MALLQLVQNFVECYVNHSKTEQTNKDQSYVNSDAASMQQGHIIPANRDRIIASADEFPSDSRLNFVTKCIVNSANRNWRKEGRKIAGVLTVNNTMKRWSATECAKASLWIFFEGEKCNSLRTNPPE